MRKSICTAALLLTLLCAQAQNPVRFSLKTSILNSTNCLANPGNVPLPLTPEQPNIEIIDWKSTPSNAPFNGEFLLALHEPTTIGSIIVYGAREVRYEADGKWMPLANPAEEGRQLQFLVPPAGDLLTRIKVIVPASQSPTRNPNGQPTFQATLPFLTMIPVRAINIAMNATVTVSSSAPTDPKRPGLNQPAAIIDGRIDPTANFSTLPRPTPITPESPEWIQVTFKEPQNIRGIILFRGEVEHGFGQSAPEVYVGDGDPVQTKGSEGWQPFRGAASTPGKFRSNEFLVGRESIDVRAFRIRSIGGARHIALGELAVLSDLGYAPVPGNQ